MKKYAVIVAGGKGARMGTDIPKQFLLINNNWTGLIMDGSENHIDTIKKDNI